MSGGTTRAQRNRLAPNLPPDTKAIRYAYGHLLGNEYRDLVDYCFLANRDERTRPPVQSCSDRWPLTMPPIPCIIDI